MTLILILLAVIESPIIRLKSHRLHFLVVCVLFSADPQFEILIFCELWQKLQLVYQRLNIDIYALLENWTYVMDQDTENMVYSTFYT